MLCQIVCPIQRNVLNVPYFHLPHQKVWFQMSIFYEKYISKSPELKYLPVTHSVTHSDQCFRCSQKSYAFITHLT